MLLLATQNAKKRAELDTLCRGAFEVRTLADVGLSELVITEDGATFADNARKKVDAVLAALSPAQQAGLFAVLADDSGLCVDALDGKPGVRSARFASDRGVGGGDAANNALLLLMLAAVPDAMRGAHFVAHVHAAVVDTCARVDAVGTVAGTIARAASGGGGFGYDPLFFPRDAAGQSMAQLSPHDKQAISHRGHAVRTMLRAFGR